MHSDKKISTYFDVLRKEAGFDLYYSFTQNTFRIFQDTTLITSLEKISE